MIGTDAQRAPVTIDRLHRLPLLIPSVAQVDQGIRVMRAEVDRLLEGFESFGFSARGLQHGAQVGVKDRRSGFRATACRRRETAAS